MPKKQNTETASEIEDAAAAWAARADRGHLTEDEQAELDRWLKADSRRLGAYARALATNSYFDRSVALGPDFVPADHAEPAARAVSGFARRKLLLAGGAAIAACAVGIAGFTLLGEQGFIETGKGDMRRVTLAEGSAVTLNTDSLVEPDLRKNLRKVALVRGEAFFNVSRDQARPFVVEAGAVSVRVLGTSFSVRRFDDGAVEVAVLSGTVEVASSLGQKRQQLTAGQRTRVLPLGEFRTERATSNDLKRRVSWRDGVLDLNGMTLGQAAAEYARYSDQKIEIADSSIAAMQVTGVYSTSDPLGFARAAALSLGLETRPTSEGLRLQYP